MSTTIKEVWRSLKFDRATLDLTNPAVFPEIPFDMFAAVGILLDRASAYRAVIDALPEADGVAALGVTKQTRDMLVRIGER